MYAVNFFCSVSALSCNDMMLALYLYLFRCACTEDRLNTIDATDTTGPIVYLLKLLVRQAGFSCLKKIVEKHKWVVPDVLRSAEVREVGSSFFVSTYV